MDYIVKLLAGYWDLILFFAILELLIIIAFVVNYLQNRNNDDNNTNGSNISNGNNNGSIWRQKCQDLNRELSDKKREIGALKQTVNLLESELKREREKKYPLAI